MFKGTYGTCNLFRKYRLFLFGLSMIVYSLLMNEKTYADELYKEETVMVKLDYTNPNFFSFTLPADGYIDITADAHISVGFNKEEDNSSTYQIGPGVYTRIKLLEGTYKIYLYDGFGGVFWVNEGSNISYRLYTYDNISNNNTSDNSGYEVEEDEEDWKDEDLEDEDDDVGTADVYRGFGYYVFEHGKCEIYDYHSKRKVIKIPEKIDGYKVVRICFDHSQKNPTSNFEKVVIPKTVEEISDESFMNSKKLKTVEFEKNSRLKNIGVRAFYNCKKLKSIKFTASKSPKIGRDALEKVNAKLKIYVPKNKYRQYRKAFTKKKGFKKTMKIIAK